MQLKQYVAPHGTTIVKYGLAKCFYNEPLAGKRVSETPK